MNIALASNSPAYERFLLRQDWSPFLQSWTMGEAYRALGEDPVRIIVEEKGEIVAICQAIVVPAKRGRHLAVMYGPIEHCNIATLQHCNHERGEILRMLIDALAKIARERACVCIRMSPFWPINDGGVLRELGFRPSPLHMLAEHIWHLDLRGKSEEEILKGMRSTTRNLIRRAEREGVTVEASEDPVNDLPIFFSLYEETRKRHHFVPYSHEFIEAQVAAFTNARNAIHAKNDSNAARVASDDVDVMLYIARYNNEPVAASIHIHYGGETSYHHGASTTRHPKCFASYLLQWTAIKDAIARGDRVYNFWGVAPIKNAKMRKCENAKMYDARHPFAGVTLFKTGFGGELLNLVHCMDLPISSRYWFTWCIEMIRKWRRGF